MSNPKSIIYRINSRDQIVFVNDLWNEVAFASDNESLTGRKIFGRSIWKFFKGYAVRDLYKQMVKTVRCGKRVRFNFRGDSPETRRLMEMDITLLENGEVQFSSKIVLAEKSPFKWLLNNESPYTEELISVCGWCKKVNVEKDTWSEVEDAVTIMGIFDTAKIPNISHGICEECFEPWMKEIDDNKVKIAG